MKLIKLVTVGILFLGANSAFAETNSFINLKLNVCRAAAPITHVISTGTAEKINIVVTPNGKVNAVCHFADDSAITEGNAEQQKIGSCNVFDETGAPLVVGGVGHVAAAANDVGDYGGGNAVFTCKGNKYTAPY